ncbi:MAG: DNA recombination protein RmuC [Gemmatimonadota bacterium]|nr:MAG: DNA recombination protein RmuC [Gemmatimonadota bacterium]
MDVIIIVVLGVLVLVFLAGLWVFMRRQERRWQEFQERQGKDQTFQVITEWLKDMRGSLDKNRATFTEQLDRTHKVIGERLDNAAKVISAVNKELGHVQEIGRTMKDFQDFLRSPKLRGNIGEQVLRDLLEQILPKENFRIQHRFKAGEVVDAAVITDKGLIPIDAKFPMENFRRIVQSESEDERERVTKDFVRDVKKHIDTIGRKYILPQEGTVDFAVMYVPAEAIYYEIVMHNANLNTYAHDKKVLLVSPNSFYYFLRVIMLGLEGKKIEETSQRILEALSTIRNDSTKFRESLGVLNTHLTHAKNAIDRVCTDYERLFSKIEDTSRLKASEHPRLEGEAVALLSENSEENQ